MRKYIVQLLPFSMLATLILLVACGAVPETDRKTINFINRDDEVRLGITEFSQIKQKMRISQDPQLNGMAQLVGSRLAEVIDIPNAQWEFVVFDDPAPNAFALPGGKVGIHSGLFQIAQNQAGLAAVIGHEVAHVVARHSGERMSRGVISAGAVALGAYLLDKEADVDPKVSAAVLGGAAALNYKAHSRSQELEADQLGALFMARAGYNPEESVRFWKRFAAYRDRVWQEQGLSLLSTHPVDSVRIASLKEYMSVAMKEYKM